MSASQAARSRQIIVAGGGIAGLTAALAFAARGFSVQLFERAPRPQEAGAGIQLSPNATRILDRLGVLDTLRPVSVRPEAVVLKRASTLAELARVPLGEAATKRWRAPYLVLHRADLLSALQTRAAQEPDIAITHAAVVRDVAFHPAGVTASVDVGRDVRDVAVLLLVAADGVWSGLRRLVRERPESRFSGRVAWRTTLRADGDIFNALEGSDGRDVVTAFLHPRAHLVAYPLRSGSAVNLVAVTRGAALAENWSSRPDRSTLAATFIGAAGPLRRLIDEPDGWTAWPVHVVDPLPGWTHPGGAALIGDAAHAMTPFAAQGAAAAIEDAYVLAATVSGAPHDLAAALTRYETIRRARVVRIAKRGAFNEFAWHASGPVGMVRDAVLGLRSGPRLAADLDWLYGWDADEALRKVA